MSIETSQKVTASQLKRSAFLYVRQSTRYVRKAYGLRSRFDRLRERGMLTISEMARLCGVSINTIGHWRKKGLLSAHAINDRGQFLFEDPGPDPPKKHSRKFPIKRRNARSEPGFQIGAVRTISEA